VTSVFLLESQVLIHDINKFNILWQRLMFIKSHISCSDPNTTRSHLVRKRFYGELHDLGSSWWEVGLITYSMSESKYNKLAIAI